jgi:hypothetical protein
MKGEKGVGSLRFSSISYNPQEDMGELISNRAQVRSCAFRARGLALKVENGRLGMEIGKKMLNVSTGLWMSCLGILVNVFFVCTCVAEEKEWVWIQVTTLQNEYRTVQGMGRVTIEKGQFVAQLFDKQYEDMKVLTIKGEIRSEQVSATVTTLDSDVAEKKYTGQYRKIFLKEFPIKTYESFALTNGRDYIGISRAY